MKKIHHIGIAVKDMEAAVKKFEKFGIKCTDIKDLGGDKIAFFPIAGTLVELLSFAPVKPTEPLFKIIQSQKGAINHLCFEVEDLDATIKDFEKGGAKLVEGCPRNGITGRTAFFYPDTTEGVLIELVESK